jgi:hypothetical protein
VFNFLIKTEYLTFIFTNKNNMKSVAFSPQENYGAIDAAGEFCEYRMLRGWCAL